MWHIDTLLQKRNRWFINRERMLFIFYLDLVYLVKNIYILKNKLSETDCQFPVDMWQNGKHLVFGCFLHLMADCNNVKCPEVETE